MQAWEVLEQECKKCVKCGLSATRTNIVFGAGKRDADILFIGEGPGENEDLKGEPFVGRAGKLLDDMLSLIGLSRDSNIYIANIVKCRPPGNRDPHPAERAACIHWLQAQIELIKPKIIVCLGRVAATTMISEDFKITRDHGQWYEYKYGRTDGNDEDNAGVAKIMAIYHPAALLRDPHKRPDTFVDLKEIQRAVNN